MQITTDLLMETLAETESTIRARFARRLGRMNQRIDLDDLCQIVAMNAWQSMDTCHAQSMTELRHWVLTIAKHTCESAVTKHLGVAKRSLRVESVVVGQATDESRDGFQPASDDLNGIDAAILRELCDAMYSILDRLSEPRRTAIIMKKLQNVSYAEIAAKLNVTEATARLMVSRGLEQASQEAAKSSLC